MSNTEMTTLDPSKKSHHRVAVCLAYGMTIPEIADHIDTSEVMVKRIAQNENTKHIVANLGELTRRKILVRRAEFDELLQESVDELRKILESPDDTKGISKDLKVRVALAVMDRHPDGEYIKNSKQTIADASGLATEAIMDLRKRASMTNAEVIDIIPQCDEDACSSQAPLSISPEPVQPPIPSVAAPALRETSDV